MIKNVFVDIDGVLNDFTRHALSWVGCKLPDGDYFDPAWGWSLYQAYLHYSDGRLTENELWESLTRECWASAPVTAECFEILDRLENYVGRDCICLLSAPPRGADQLAGKLEWIQRHMPKWLQRQYLFGPKKYFCAHPDHLLIDDADHNCQSFIKHGGRAILLPRPWNSNHDLPTLDYITLRLDEMKWM